MKVLYFDCFSGISGDMALGALLDLGIDKDVFLKELNKLNLKGYEIVIDKKTKSGIVGTDVNVIVEGVAKCGHNEHEHHHHHHHDESHTHRHEQKGHVHGHEARNLLDIEALIDESSLNKPVKDLSKKIFREIAKAEAKVHNKCIEEVHFHEVGAVDSIVDIVGTSICIDLLGIEKVFSSPLHDGKGFIKCQHGFIPVPVPAVMEMLCESNIPLISEDVNTELVTPTGMGIIKCLAGHFGNMPQMHVDKAGYGMGKRDTGRFNALRVVLGTLADKAGMTEDIVVLETNIDDMSPEIMGYTAETLLQNGALDVFYTPVYMKKSRPGVMLTVLSDKEKEQRLVDIILRETSTLGIRRSVCGRYCMDRNTVKVNTRFGEVRIKAAFLGDIKKASPEYEDLKDIAKKTGMPLMKVFEMAMEEFKRQC